MKKNVLVKQHDETDCGAACLASVCKYYGKTVSIARIRNYSGTDVMGTSGLGIIRGAEKLGFSCKGMISQKKKLSTEVPYPVICHVRKKLLDHYVVVYGFKKNYVIVADPDAGILKVRIQDFTKEWSGVFFVLVPEVSFTKSKEALGFFSRYKGLLKPFKKTVIECFAAGIILSLLGVISAFYFRFLIDDVLYSGLKNTLTVCSISYLVVIVFQVATDYSRNQLMNFMSNKIDMVLIAGYFRHILRLPMDFFTSRKTGEIISRIGDTQVIRHTISSTTLSVVIDSCMLLLGGLFLVLFGSSLLPWAVVPVLIRAVIVFVFVKPFRLRIKKQAVLEAEKQSALVECVNGIGTVKALNSEEKAFMRCEERIVSCVRQSINLGTLSNFENALHCLAGTIGNLALYWAGARMILSGTLSLGELISFVTLSGYFTSPLGRLLTLQESLQEAAVASARLGEILDMEEEGSGEEGEKLHEINRIEGRIEVRDLSFSYGTRGEALKHVNLRINPGEKVAFVGTSGSGKTTMTKLLMKFYKAQKGSIFIDGMNLNDISTESVRSQTGYVPQEVLLFSGTIAENIMWGCEGNSLNDVFEASVKAGAHEFIDRLPDRYRTIVGERGATLSGGERQRISLARVLLRKPSFMILDEATSSLDSISEHKIMQAIDAIGNETTMILVAHRLSTIKNCSRIFVFDKGRIVESGTHNELMKIGGHYYRMWQAQEGKKGYFSE